MTQRFEGHAALITGAARGIGAATARRLAAEGARVLLTDADEVAARATAAAIPGAEPYRLDVRIRAEAEAAVAHAVERFGRLDVLVNNAYAAGDDAELFEDESDEVWERDIDVCLGGAFRCSRAALPHLVASGRGAIVTIGSVNAEADFGGHAYSAAKAALTSLTRTLAGHAGPRGVRVNLVEPGTVRTTAWADRPAHLEAFAGLYPLGRVGEPEDVAAAVAYLASADASWVTGTTLRVDGGILAVQSGFRQRAAAVDEATARGETGPGEGAGVRAVDGPGAG
ncbi:MULTISPECIES: SDR family oxidoreductase [unclassified Streptomyces]|uniref:SDR family NAD(P)-dependent oxidoreductase n=1 Tax=unclassified Streptomyces TaxID=2593676 RepID=UPI00081D75BD|nr:MULTISPECIES: SDR family oxidoreductase [unclassified Streptomyces]MYR24690.1 SDR family oxidoreductase [Streptomyces sp. SID4945]SCD76556.1 NAD(P)-dependent dehydrogenase, short-chain alcohol dehydrogenase family [Streptomyces sp. TverLS-915]SCE65255.1 NAD(P)-dependent dehydrogenase, short-chain alcohol dehydrogenase family [Streptomyces sp. LcepLS]